MEIIKIPDSVWEGIFSKFYYKEKNRTNLSNYLWSGFYDNENNLAIGHKVGNNDEWYYDSEITRVDLLSKFFGTNLNKPITDSLKDFLNKKYGFNIKRLI